MKARSRNAMALALVLASLAMVSGCTQEQGPLDNSSQPGSAATYSLAEISQHSTREDCWLAINGKVYNVTGFIAQAAHPGGAAILQGCGKDATTFFETRPMGSGTPHSQTARGYLANYYIGGLQ